jgi:hypothetical protein
MPSEFLDHLAFRPGLGIKSAKNRPGDYTLRVTVL